MRIRLLVAMKVRLPEGGFRILSPGIYDERNGSFPEVLREESRFGVVEIIDSTPVEMPGSNEEETDPESEKTDPESEKTDPESEKTDPALEEEEGEEEVEAPKKKKIKRRG